MATTDHELKHHDQSDKGGSPPPPPNKNIQFNVEVSGALSAATYQIKATSANDDPYLKGPNKQTIDLPNGVEWYDIVFHVVDKIPGEKVIFDENEPICAQSGGGCPAAGTGINTDQLSLQERKDKKLTLENKNQTQLQIGYTLFFVDEKTKQALNPPFDPIMDNGGGGHNLM